MDEPSRWTEDKSRWIQTTQDCSSWQSIGAMSSSKFIPADDDDNKQIILRVTYAMLTTAKCEHNIKYFIILNLLLNISKWKIKAQKNVLTHVYIMYKYLVDPENARATKYEKEREETR